MRRIREVLDRHRPAAAVAALLLGAALFPAGPDGLRARLAGLGAPLALLRASSGAPGAGPDSADTRRLREEVEWLQGRVRTLEAENAGLREFRSLRLDARKQPLRVVAARVAARDAAWPYRRSVLIDRGTEDGLRRGLPAVSGKCLVGFVAEAGPRTSRIQLLDDPGPRADDARLRAAVRVFRPGSKEEGAEGVLSGERRDLLRVRMLPAGAAVPGDLVVTSGADPLVPEGLVVGRVLDAGEDGSPKLAAAHVAPSADLAGLREVFVLVAPEADVRAERGAKR